MIPVTVSRAFIYLSGRLHGYRFPIILNKYRGEIGHLDSPGVLRSAMNSLLEHCSRNVPYYRDLMKRERIRLDQEQPEDILPRFPILTKDTIRRNFEALKSEDLSKRTWHYNTSGGSTGEPIRLIQDRHYFDISNAIDWLYSHMVGYETGEPLVYIWGSERDIIQGTKGFRANMSSCFANLEYLNAFRMTESAMRDFIKTLNRKKPKLIIAYAQAAYELASFAEKESCEVVPQAAIITSAGTLYPFMREKIERVFRCRVYNRYGSREVGAVACEGPGYDGLWVAPWGNYVEVVDEEGKQVPPGEEGNLLITCLANHAMPLIRYSIGDRGTLWPDKEPGTRRAGQVLKKVSGRNVDTFKAPGGVLIDGEYFTHLLYFRDWVKRFQVVQKTVDNIRISVVKTDKECPISDLKDIKKKIRLLMGETCNITISFVDDIPASSSGKYRYTISEVR